MGLTHRSVGAVPHFQQNALVGFFCASQCFLLSHPRSPSSTCLSKSPSWYHPAAQECRWLSSCGMGMPSTVGRISCIQNYHVSPYLVSRRQKNSCSLHPTNRSVMPFWSLCLCGGSSAPVCALDVLEGFGTWPREQELNLASWTEPCGLPEIFCVWWEGLAPCHVLLLLNGALKYLSWVQE